MLYASNSVLKKETEIIDDLIVWINMFSWEENSCQTDAHMKFTISGINGSHLEERVDVWAINTRIIKQVVLNKASQFIDVYVIEDLSWSIEDVKDECGEPMKEICVYAEIHLAQPGCPFDGIYDEDE